MANKKKMLKKIKKKQKKEGKWIVFFHLAADLKQAQIQKSLPNGQDPFINHKWYKNSSLDKDLETTIHNGGLKIMRKYFI